MIRRIAISALIAFSFTTAAHADIREVGQGELRRLVKAGQAYGLSDIMKAYAANLEGEFVDARAFDADGLVYALMFVMPDGKVATVVIDAISAQVLPARSSRAATVVQVAKQTPGTQGNSSQAANKSNGKAKGKDKGKDKGKGKGKK